MPTITYEPPCPVSMQGSALIADAPCTPLFIAGTCSTTMVGSCPLLRPKSGSHTGMRFLPALVCCAFASSHRQRLSILSILMTRYTSSRYTAPHPDGTTMSISGMLITPFTVRMSALKHSRAFQEARWPVGNLPPFIHGLHKLLCRLIREAMVLYLCLCAFYGCNTPLHCA